MKKPANIPFVDLISEYLAQQRELEHAIKEVLASGIYVLGQQVTAFEEEFGSYLQISYATGVASGTDALILSLKALGVTSEDEVIIPANSYPTAFAVAASGGRIRLVDVDPHTYTIDPAKLEKAITPSTKAIIPVHLYGRMADMDEIMRVARKRKLFVVEDAVQAHGAVYKGKKAGTIGDIGCFSFFPTKNLGGIGDGGMIVTADKQMAQAVRELRAYGETKRYESIRLSVHSRLDEIQAAVLRVRLQVLNARNKKRRTIAAWYRKYLQGLSVVVSGEQGESHVYHLFVIQTSKRNMLQQFLAKNGVDTLIHYPIPIHLVPSFSLLGYKKGDFPVSEKLAKTILSLPCYPELEKEKIRRVSSLVKTFLNM